MPPDAPMLQVLRTARRAGVRFTLDTTTTPPQVRITGATKHLLTHALRSDLRRHKLALSVRLCWERSQQQEWHVQPCAGCGGIDPGCVRVDADGTEVWGCLTCTPSATVSTVDGSREATP
jgi:hypothetical protein